MTAFTTSDRGSAQQSTLTYHIQLAIAILEDAKELAKAMPIDHKGLEAKLLELTKAESQIWIEYDRIKNDTN